MVRNSENVAYSEKLRREWLNEEAELNEINARRKVFGRRALNAAEWSEIRKSVVDQATADGLQKARELAVYDPNRDGQRWGDAGTKPPAF